MLLDSIYIAGYYVLQAQKRNQISFVLFDIMDVYCGAGREQQAEQSEVPGKAKTHCARNFHYSLRNSISGRDALVSSC